MTLGELKARRDHFVAWLWDGSGIPTTSTPANVQTQGMDQRVYDVPNQTAVEGLVWNHDLGYASAHFHWTPTTPNGSLVIYCQGHSYPGDRYGASGEIASFLGLGYHVVEIAMPGYWPNSYTFPDAGVARSGADNHFWMADFDAAGFTKAMLRSFVEPPIFALNYLLDSHRFDNIVMAGLSGGGWTTTLLAAVDRRINLSFPIAGTLPLNLRQPRDIGDWEQEAARPWHSYLDYRTQYALGGLGRHRRQLQILHHTDSCCFSYDPVAAQVDAYVAEVSSVLGDDGNFALWVDAGPEHAVSATAIARIHADVSTYGHRISSTVWQSEIGLGDASDPTTWDAIDTARESEVTQDAGDEGYAAVYPLKDARWVFYRSTPATNGRSWFVHPDLAVCRDAARHMGEGARLGIGAGNG